MLGSEYPLSNMIHTLHSLWPVTENLLKLQHIFENTLKEYTLEVKASQWQQHGSSELESYETWQFRTAEVQQEWAGISMASATGVWD